jgi:hypothetical protein
MVENLNVAAIYATKDFETLDGIQERTDRRAATVIGLTHCAAHRCVGFLSEK